jgi:hypothetical protein
MTGVYADLVLNTGALSAVSDALARKYLTAGKASVVDATKWLERELEALTRDAVPGKLWRAWASETFPRGGGIARNPAGTVFVNGRKRSEGAMKFWTQPGRISGSYGQWLAIPTDAAGSRGRMRDLTPGQWEAATGQRLRFVYRGGRRSALLVAEGTVNARSGGYRAITRKRTAADARRGFVRGNASIVIFVLVPFVAFGNRVAIGPAVRQAEGRMVKDFVARVGRI